MIQKASVFLFTLAAHQSERSAVCGPIGGWDHSSKGPNLQAWNTSSSSMCRSRGGRSRFCRCLSLGSLHAAAAHPRLKSNTRGPIAPVLRLYFSASFMSAIMNQAAFYFCVESKPQTGNYMGCYCERFTSEEQLKPPDQKNHNHRGGRKSTTAWQQGCIPENTHPQTRAAATPKVYGFWVICIS